MSKRQGGFTMVEIAVAMGLMGALSVVVLKLVKSTTGFEISRSANKEINSLLQQMKAIVENPEACRNSFENFDALSSTPNEIKDESNAVFFRTGENYNKIQITSMSITPPVANTANYISPSSVGFIQVNVTFSRNMNSDTPMIKNKKFKLWVKTDSVNRIANCAGVSNISSNLWRRSNQDANKIFYQGGRVAVGTNDFNGLPALMVTAGNLRGNTDSNDGIDIGGNSSSTYAITLNAYKKLVFKERISGINASIKSNSVSVAQEFTAGPPTSDVACDSTTVGSIRYQSGILQWCGRTPIAWRNFVDE